METARKSPWHSRQESHDPPALRDFRDWLDTNWEYGTVGPETVSKSNNLRKACRFLPKSKLRAYFNKSDHLYKILVALFPAGIPDNVDEDTILREYIQIFGILLFIRQGQQIIHFVEHDSLKDNFLPFGSIPPDSFPYRLSEDVSFYPDFSQDQWRFCTPTISWKRRAQWPSECILPILVKEPIDSGANATTFRIELHPDYNELRSLDSPQPARDDPEYNTFALKTYDDEDDEHHENEISAFLKVRRDHPGAPASQGIIGFYGSFKQDGKFNIILEYANQGTLEDYFLYKQPPQSPKDIATFWASLLELLKPLMNIHEVRESDEEHAQYLLGWHQDVKPQNILVCKRGERSIYECDFKLADLGLSHFKRYNGKSGGIDNPGNRIYGAPEAYRIDEYTSRLVISVTPNVDVWSIGCVLSEAATWVVHGLHGTHGLSDYRQNRKYDTAGVESHQTPGCFHDGMAVLPSVRVQHSGLRLLLDGKHNEITKRIINMIEQMLWHYKHRETSQHFYHESRKILSGSAIERNVTSLPAEVGQLERADISVAQRRSTDPPRQPESDAFGGDSPLKLTSSPESLGIADAQNVPATLIRSSTISTIDSMQRQTAPGSSEFSANILHRLPTGSSDAGASKVLGGSFIKNPISGQEHRPNNQFQSPHSSPSLNHDGDSNPPSLPVRGPRALGSAPGVSTNQPPMDVPPTSPPAHSPPPPPTRLLRMVTSNRRTPPPWPLATAEQWKRDGKSAHDLDVNMRNELERRDHLLLIDDSVSMRDHWIDVVKLVDILAYILKDFDKNGIDLLFTNSPEKCNSKDHAVLVEKTKRTHPPLELTRCTDIDFRLGPILRDYTKKLRQARHNSFTSRMISKVSNLIHPVRCLNIYVFTDGMWQPGDEIADNVLDLLNTLIETRRRGNQVGIQFIQFGNDPDGCKRLRTLDLLRSDKDKRKDVVDTEPADGDVRKILLGAINRWYDDDELDDDFPNASTG